VLCTHPNYVTNHHHHHHKQTTTTTSAYGVGHADCIGELLLRQGASNMADGEGRHALTWAVMKGSLAVCQMLLEKLPATATSADNYGRTALHAAS
jgi:hypothetical protein